MRNSSKMISSRTQSVNGTTWRSMESVEDSVRGAASSETPRHRDSQFQALRPCHSTQPVSEHHEVPDWAGKTSSASSASKVSAEAADESTPACFTCCAKDTTIFR